MSFMFILLVYMWWMSVDFLILYILLGLIMLFIFIPFNGLSFFQEIIISNSIFFFNSSFMLMILTILSGFSCFMSIYSMNINKKYVLNMLILLLMYFSYMFFFTCSWFKFYMYFEFSLIPILLIILGWGYQSERLLASKALMMYTILGSVPLLLFLMFSWDLGVFYIWQVNQINLMSFFSNWIFIFLTLAFLVKLPIMFFHMWLPKAHVEAPVMGSMFLAAVLLKLGGFGMIKFKELCSMNFLNTIILSISFWSLIFISMICIQSSDMKVLIAFSSVAHMAVVVILFFIDSKISEFCMILVMISHGFSSSMSFYMSFLIYKMSGSRSMIINKSLSSFSGLIVIFWSMSCLGVMGAPPTFNLWVEINCFLIIITEFIMSNKILFWSAFLTGAYSFLLMIFPQVFNSYFYSSNFNYLHKCDIMHLIFLSMILIFMFIFGSMMIN